MTERSLPWVDATGDGGPYSQDQLRLMVRAMGRGGLTSVLPGEGQEFFPYSTGNNNVTILSGVGPVDGTIHESDATKPITISSPSGGTTGKRIVRRKDWTAQTVRLVEISSADGTAAIPALTQTDGVTWEESVCSFTITTGGVIDVLTDERVWPGGITRMTHPALSGARNREMLINWDAIFSVNADEGYLGGGLTVEVIGSVNLNPSNEVGTNGAVSFDNVDAASDEISVTSGASTSVIRNPVNHLWGMAFRFNSLAASGVNRTHVYGAGAARQISGNTYNNHGAFIRDDDTETTYGFVTRASSETTTDIESKLLNAIQDVEIVAIDIGGTRHYFLLIDREIVADHTTNLPSSPLFPIIAIRMTGITVGLDSLDYIQIETERDVA